jgi:hypothetical protein
MLASSSCVALHWQFIHAGQLVEVRRISQVPASVLQTLTDHASFLFHSHTLTHLLPSRSHGPAGLLVPSHKTRCPHFHALLLSKGSARKPGCCPVPHNYLPPSGVDTPTARSTYAFTLSWTSAGEIQERVVEHSVERFFTDGSIAELAGKVLGLGAYGEPGGGKDQRKHGGPTWLTCRLGKGSKGSRSGTAQFVQVGRRECLYPFRDAGNGR